MVRDFFVGALRRLRAGRATWRDQRATYPKPTPARQAPIWLAASVLLAVVAHAEIEFTGVLVTPGQSLFALIDEPGKPVVWRAIGQEFAGYSLAAFEAKTDTLVLTKDGAPLRLHLKDDAKVKNARVELSGAFSVGHGDKIEVTRVTLAYDQETVLPLKDGFIWHITPTREPDGNIRFRLIIDRNVPNGEGTTTKRVSAPTFIARPGTTVSMVIGELEFSFTPSVP